ncbi:hypothetical protein MTO96_008720 [Rhipicephalus appendiculatus]
MVHSSVQPVPGHVQRSSASFFSFVCNLSYAKSLRPSAVDAAVPVATGQPAPRRAAGRHRRRTDGAVLIIRLPAASDAPGSDKSPVATAHRLEHSLRAERELFPELSLCVVFSQTSQGANGIVPACDSALVSDDVLRLPH